MCVEEALQYQYGSHLVDDLAMPGKGPSGGVEVAMGFGGGQPLVPEVDGQREGGAQGVGKDLSFRGLGAHIPGHIQRVAEDDGRTPVFAEQAAEGFQVGFRISADQGQNRLRGQPQLIGDGNPDATISEIEAKKARWHRRIVARRIRAGRRKKGILQ
jgi:hypothetical protein